MLKYNIMKIPICERSGKIQGHMHFQVQSITLRKNDILDRCSWKHGCLDGTSSEPSNGAEIHVSVVTLESNKVSVQKKAYFSQPRTIKLV
jgi:hypothetical protein